MSFQYKLSAKNFVPLQIRGARVFGKYFEMRLFKLDGSIRSRAILQHEKIPQEGRGTIQVCALPESHPEIQSTADRLFGPVVEIVAKGWPDLGFCLDGDQQVPVSDDQEVPFLGWPEEPGEFHRLFPKNMLSGDPGSQDEIREKINEPIHLRAARDSAPKSPVYLAELFLLFNLDRPGLPISGHCASGPFRQFEDELVFGFRHDGSGSSPLLVSLRLYRL